MKLFSLLVAVLALALPLGLWASSSHHGLMTDRNGAAAPSVALGPSAGGYAAR